MKIALFQMNPVVGDLENNARKIVESSKSAEHQGAELLICPELALVGYPPKDLLLRGEFLKKTRGWLEYVASHVSVPTVVGAPYIEDSSRMLYNAAFLCSESEVKLVCVKTLLPNYGVFDEKRYFEAGDPDSLNKNILEIKNKKIGLTICEDIWQEFGCENSRRHPVNPMADLLLECPELDFIVNLSASPFSSEKQQVRDDLLSELAAKYKKPILMAGQVGANDALVFDGHSCAYDSAGNCVARAKDFEEGLIVVDLADMGHGFKAKSEAAQEISQISKALELGVRDYVNKTNSRGVLIGLSGGIDSAVVAALAVNALGADRVVGVRMPSKYSSGHSLSDAQDLADGLGICLQTKPIESVVQTYRDLFQNDLPDLADQNLQARARGMILMAESNRTGFLVLATGNKSELAVGYATLYGDMCGALAPIGDLYKTEVYELANHLNLNKNIISKPPSAELKANQFDSDGLPEYEFLDSVLNLFFEENLGLQEILQRLGHGNSDEIEQVINLIYKNEFKRQQAPICLMVSSQVFNSAHRWPIVQVNSHCRENK